MEEIRGEYTVKDYIMANRLHISRNPSWKWSRIFLYILSFVYVLLIICSPGNIIYWIFLFLFFIIANYPYAILPYWARRYYKLQKMHGETVISVDSDGNLCSKSQKGETKQKWVFRYLSSKDMLMVYNTPLTFIMIPRRFCKGEEQFAQFVNAAKELSQKDIG